MHVTLPHGLVMTYERHGSARDPVLVLINGLGQQLTAWPDDLLTGWVQRGWQVLRFDNRDVGLSARHPAPYRLHDMARDTIGLLDALHMTQVHVLGVSMGGMIAQHVAAEWPERVRSLTSIMSSSGAPAFQWHWSPAIQAMLTPPPSHDPSAVLEHLEHIEHYISSPTMREPAPIRRARLLRQISRAFDPAGIARQLTAVITDGDRRATLRRIQAPALVIHGELDPVLPLAAGRDTADHITNARFYAIPNMAHDLPAPLRPHLLSLISDHCATASNG